MLENFKELVYDMMLKIHFFYLEHFPENLSTFNEEQGEGLRQDIKFIKNGNKGTEISI